jgi:hypothetical protein
MEVSDLSARCILLLLAVVSGGMAAPVTGCGGSEPKALVVPLNQVPEPLLKTAREKLPMVKFVYARKLANGNYEIRGTAKNGKTREVELTPLGEVVEIE